MEGENSSMDPRDLAASRRFVDLGHVLRRLPGKSVRLEPRPARWKFGCLNYGEVAENWHNAADGDRWDVFAPGYEAPLPTNTLYTVREVLGILKLENGNHKIAVRIATPGYRADRADREVGCFAQEYTRRMRLRGRYEVLRPRADPPRGRPASPRSRRA